MRKSGWLIVFNVASGEGSVENDKQVDDPDRICGFQGGVSRVIISCDSTRPNVVGKHCLWSLQVTIFGLPVLVCNIHMTFGRGTRWRRWLRDYVTSRKASGSTPDGVLGIFHWLNNGWKGYLLGIKAAGVKGWNPHNLHVRIVPQLTRSLRPYPGLYRDCFTRTFGKVIRQKFQRFNYGTRRHAEIPLWYLKFFLP
jgi:hypothetical protein